MSKTKEEILQYHNLHGPGLAHQNYLSAMDEYAAQVLSEYKEKLKAEVKKDIDYYQSIKLTEYGEGYLVGLKDIDKLIKGPL